MSSARLHPMGIGEILDGTFSLYRKHFALMFGTAILPFALMVPGYATLMQTTAIEDPVAVGASIGLTFVLIGVGALGMVIAMAALTRNMSQAFTGAEASFGDGLRSGVRALLPLIGAVIVAYIVIFALSMAVMMGLGLFAAVLAAFAGVLGVIVALVGVFLVIATMIAIAASLFAVIPAVVVERKGPIAALVRSWRLSHGARLRIATVFFLCWLITMLPSLGIMLALGMGMAFIDPTAAATMTTGQIYLQQSVTMLISALTFPFTLGCLVLLYYDRRIRTEAYDVEVAAEAIVAATP